MVLSNNVSEPPAPELSVSRDVIVKTLSVGGDEGGDEGHRLTGACPPAPCVAQERNPDDARACVSLRH